MSKNQFLKRRLICLTGGVATGKSRVATWLGERNWKVICTDEIVHRLYQPGQPVVFEIAHEFGDRVLDPDGKVNRKELAKIVFRNTTALHRLNEIVHPRVRSEWKQAPRQCSSQEKRVVVVIPLAYEVGVVKEFSEVWVVACSEAEQRRRLRKRGMDDLEIHRRLAAQWPLQKKIDYADGVIWNDGSWNITEKQLDAKFL